MDEVKYMGFTQSEWFAIYGHSLDRLLVYLAAKDYTPAGAVANKVIDAEVSAARAGWYAANGWDAP